MSALLPPAWAIPSLLLGVAFLAGLLILAHIFDRPEGD